MDDQPPKQAPPTPYARAQQLTDSPAASLPTETLTHIIDLALQDLKPLERQKTRISVSNVCKHWWTVAASERELVVQGSKQAGRLAEALLEAETAERQEAVKSLVIQLGAITDANDIKAPADLLLSCPKLERLSLTFTEGLASEAKYRILGKHLRDALTTCSDLRELELLGNMIVPPSDFDRILQQLPCLLKLVIPSADLRAVWAYEHLPARNSLEALVINITDYTLPKDIAQTLIKSSLSTLMSIRLGVNHRLRFNLEEVADALLPAAGQLRHIELPATFPDPAFVDPPLYLPLLLARLSSIRTLSLGLFGYDLDALFGLLTPLHTLESLILRAPPWYPDGFRRPTLKYSDTFNYVRSAGGRQLQSLCLPTNLTRGWSEVEMEDFTRAAGDVEVDLSFH